jgi:prepilin-type N-terminal cleavage/methylation domain-containing protein
VTTRKGFTLIELMVVIAVIGILAAVALISLTGVQRSARDATRKSNVSDYATALARYYQDNQAYPVSASDSIGGPPTAPSPAGTGIFSAAGALVSAKYMPTALADPLGGGNCKASGAGASINCQYSYTGASNGFTIWSVLETPTGATSTNSGVFYVTSSGTRGLSPTGVNCAPVAATGLDTTNCP